MDDHVRRVLPAGYEIAGYKIVRVIGQGGFGIVYEARNPITLERVAIKQFYPSAIATWREGTVVLNNSDDRELVRRVLKNFRDEAIFLHQADHPNILKVLNYVDAENTGYMISTFVEGQSLANFLSRTDGHFVDEDIFRHTMEPIVGALGYIHRRHKLHRDISPDNIMIDHFGKAVLIDFGAAKFDLRQSQVFSSVVQLKPEYAPPEQQEQLAQNPVGAYTDIFALAGTMYCSLAGTPPGRAMARALAHPDFYVPIGKVSRIKCPPEVYQAIDHGLRLASVNRPRTIEEFADTLRWRPEYGSPPPEPTDVIVGPSGPGTPGPGGGIEIKDKEIRSRGRRSGVIAVIALLLAVIGVIGAIWYIQTTSSGQSTSSIPPRPPPLPQQAQPPQQQQQQAQPQPQVQEKAQYDAARGNLDKLKQYADSCSRCEFLDAARREIEGLSYQAAAKCISGSTACNLDGCLAPYRANVGTGGRYASLKADADLITNGPICKPPPPPPQPTYTTYDNMDIEGGDFPGPPHLRNANEQDCVSACRARGDSCIGYVYGKWDRVCYLKQTLANTYSRKEPKAKIVLRSNLTLPGLSTLPEEIKRRSLVFTGNRLERLSRASRDACSTACERESRCLAYTYSGGNCDLFDRTDFAERNESAQSGVKAQYP